MAGDYYKSSTILYSEYQFRDSVSLLPNSIEQYAYTYALALSGKELKAFSIDKDIKKSGELANSIKAAQEKVKKLMAASFEGHKNKKHFGRQEKQLEQIFNDIEFIDLHLRRFVRKNIQKKCPSGCRLS